MNQNEIRKAIANGSCEEDHILFTSPSMEEFFNTFVAGVTSLCESQIKVNLKWEDTDQVAFASNRNEVTLNCGCSMLQNKARKDRFIYLKGLALHECGHLIWTDYQLLKNKMEQFQNYALDPDPQTVESREVISYVKQNPDILSPLLSLLKTIDNSIEDGYIEFKLLNLCGGYSKNLIVLRNWQSSIFENWSKMKAAGSNDGVILLNSILAFGKYHKDLQDDEQNIELNQIYEDIKELVLKAVHEDTCILRSLYINNIFAKVAYYLLIDLMNNPPKENQSTKSQENTSENAPSAGSNNSEQKKCSNKNPSNNGKQDISDALKSIANSAAVVNADEGEHQLQDAPQNTKTFTQRDIPRNLQDMGAAQELDGIERAENRRIKQEDTEKDILKQLNHLKNQLSKSSIELCVSRAMPGDPVLYSEVKKSVEPIVKKLTNELLQRIESKCYGEYERHLYSGTSIDMAGFLQRDGKAFSKKRLPESIPEFCISVLIDESGSMRGEKENIARTTAFAIYSFCHNLHIPVSIYGHHVRSKSVEIKSYADFNSIDGKDSLRIMSTSAHGSNRDGDAIKFVAQHMLLQQRESNILIIISDGKPSCYSSKDEALTEMHQVISEYSKKGIMMIAAGIADDNEELRLYYEEGIPKRYRAKFLDISDLSAMPKRFVKMLITHIEEYIN